MRLALAGVLMIGMLTLMTGCSHGDPEDKSLETAAPPVTNPTNAPAAAHHPGKPPPAFAGGQPNK